MGEKVNLINGNFITLDNQCPNAEKISIKDGKIFGINSADHHCKNIDLKGATVIPGFVDAHFHLVNLGKQKDSLQLRNCRSASSIANKVFQKRVWKRYLPINFFILFIFADNFLEFFLLFERNWL